VTDIAVVQAFIALANLGIRVELLHDRRMIASPFSAPRIKELLAAHVHVYTQKDPGQKTEHQKVREASILFIVILH
jgi:hypothetical protein